VELSVFPVNRLLEELQAQFQPIALKKGIRLKLVPCRISVHSDPALLRIILQNLVSNAIKYTEHGRVIIGCRRRDEMLRICVCDTGIGIAEDRQEDIFEAFFQLDNPARDRKQGAGFGLAIVQRVADLLKHPLHVRSVPGKGSCFTVDLPISGKRESAIAGIPDTTLPEETTTRNLLLIDDDEVVLHANSLMLEMQGYHVIPVLDAAAAFDIIATDQQQPEIIISDYRLPGAYTGTELISELRSRAGWQIPAIILTGDITLGNDGEFLPDKSLLVKKPVSAKKLQQGINQLLIRYSRQTNG